MRHDPSSRRQLRIIVDRSAGGAPLLIGVALVSALPGCSSGDPIGEAAAWHDASSEAVISVPEASANGDVGITVPVSDAAAEDTPVLCDGFTFPETYTVELPPAGVPADPGQLCQVDVEPVESNRSARVTFTRYSSALEMAQGLVTVDPSLEVVSVPVVSVVDATREELKQIAITDMAQVAGGFTFHAAWPPLGMLEPDGYEKITVRVAFAIACAASEGGVGDGGAVRQVQSMTYVHLCRGSNGAEWVSSGDGCTVCRIIAEMAPSPIVPDKTTDDLPLARALRLRIALLARVGRAVVLFAENDGGEELSYEWHPSSGKLERVADDLVVWTLPDDPGGQVLQLAVCGNEGAAVASYTWEEAAWAQALVA